MPATISENGIHKLEVQSQTDGLAGSEMAVYYLHKYTGETQKGDVQPGVPSGDTVTFYTDLKDAGVTPGDWRWELVREAGGVKRGVTVEGVQGRGGSVRVLDTKAIS